LLESAWFQPLKGGLLVSKFAFTINLYRYAEVLKYKKVGKESSKLHKVEITSEREGWRPVDTVAAKDAWSRDLAHDVKRKAELKEEAATIKRKEAEAKAEATRRKDGAEAEEAKRKAACDAAAAAAASSARAEAEEAKRKAACAAAVTAATAAAAAATAAAATAAAAAAASIARTQNATANLAPVTPSRTSSSTTSQASPTSTLDPPLDLENSPASEVRQSCPVLTKALSMHTNKQLKSKGNKLYQTSSMTKDALSLAVLKTAKQRMSNTRSEAAEDNDDTLLQKFLRAVSPIKAAEKHLSENKTAAAREVKRILFGL
jgi:hypothetical protein